MTNKLKKVFVAVAFSIVYGILIGIGFAALALLITAACVNVKKSKSLGIRKFMCVCEIFLSVVLAIPTFIGFNALL